MEHDDCPFCKIARGDDPATHLIWEAETWVAFFPLEPATTGHTLIIPRMHVPNFWDLDEKLAHELTDASLMVGRAVGTVLSPDGLNLITSAGEAAEQTIFHLHLHIVPRWVGDKFGHIWPKDGHADDTALASTARQIKAALSAQ